MASNERPGQPPGDSGGPPGRGTNAYPLYVLIVLAVVMIALIAIAVWAGSLVR